MKTDKNGKDLIKSFEGLRLQAYTCPAGVLTIGYGHTKGVRPGMTVTEEQAEELLDSDLAEVDNAISRLVTTDISQAQHNALADFIFNVGETNFRSSTLLKKINGGSGDAEIADEFRRWVYSGNKILGGLKTRREAEAQLWMNG